MTKEDSKVKPNPTNEDNIKPRAYELWDRRGRPEGYDLEFWLQAERELKSEEENGERTRANDETLRSGSGSDGPG
jgi:hypothetical protein